MYKQAGTVRCAVVVDGGGHTYVHTIPYHTITIPYPIPLWCMV